MQGGRVAASVKNRPGCRFASRAVFIKASFSEISDFQRSAGERALSQRVHARAEGEEAAEGVVVEAADFAAHGNFAHIVRVPPVKISEHVVLFFDAQAEGFPLEPAFPVPVPPLAEYVNFPVFHADAHFALFAVIEQKPVLGAGAEVGGKRRREGVVSRRSVQEQGTAAARVLPAARKAEAAVRKADAFGLKFSVQAEIGKELFFRHRGKVVKGVLRIDVGSGAVERDRPSVLRPGGVAHDHLPPFVIAPPLVGVQNKMPAPVRPAEGGGVSRRKPALVRAPGADDGVIGAEFPAAVQPPRTHHGELTKSE